MKKLIYILVAALLFNCESTEDILVDLPEFDEEMVVECYLQDGVVPRAFLSQSVGYFENKPISVNDAVFKIIGPNKKYSLKNQVKEDQEYTKYYNYIGNDTMRISAGEELSISVQDSKGRIISGKTRALGKVTIDSVSYNYNNSGFAFPVIHFYDNPQQKNYYRYTLKKVGDDDLTQDFVFDDYLLNGKSVMGTGSRFKKGDKLTFTLYHIDKKYFDYLNSINGAQSANFSAFSQPYPIKSTLDKGLGVFTVLTYHRLTVELK